MTDHPKSRRFHIIAPSPVTVPVGRGLIEFQPGWTGPVVPEVAAYLEARPHVAEVWRDGEPPAPGQPEAREEVTTVRVAQGADGPRFEDVTEEPPPLEAPASAAMEGEAE